MKSRLMITLAFTVVCTACSTSDPARQTPSVISETAGATTPAPIGTIPPIETATATADKAPQWSWTGSEWANLGGPAPACPEPMSMLPPVDLSLATSTLYPGQVRGDYKAHGGFRFDGLAPEDVQVTAPMDGHLVRIAHYLATGEVQYTLDMINDCGIMIRFGHVLDVPPEIKALFKDFPPPVELDSRSTYLPEPFAIDAGQVLGLSVGVKANANTFFDFGVYDLRQRNESSSDAAWFAEHNNDTHAYGVCWFPFFGAEAEALITGLPAADGQMGRTSDYCR